MEFILVIIGIIFVIAIVMSIVNMHAKKRIQRIDRNFDTEFGKFKATGNMERFIISKDEKYEFLVENGVIVACKDNQRHSEFVYYGGDEIVK